MERNGTPAGNETVTAVPTGKSPSEIWWTVLLDRIMEAVPRLSDTLRGVIQVLVQGDYGEPKPFCLVVYGKQTHGFIGHAEDGSINCWVYTTERELAAWVETSRAPPNALRVYGKREVLLGLLTQVAEAQRDGPERLTSAA